ELKTVADTLAVKQYSKIIETANGYFIIKKTAEKIAGDAEESHSFSTYLEKGKTAYKNKNFAKAIDYLEKAVKLEPENQEAHYFLGYAYELYSDPDGSLLTELQRKPIEKASKHFQKLIEISPKYEGELLDFHPYDKLTSVWGYLAMAYAYHGKTDSARWAFKQGRAAGGFYPAILEFNKNILASCEENAILFTFGEKVIFPIWFLRFMEGYRRDVNVVDLSLLNHAWYVKMLKNDDP
ncbi:MAG: tetratricopeptide repeat protein, partial [Aliifodinibius sp.]|nr:tetratricopeptide repeat protein [Fodinibius sp.]